MSIFASLEGISRTLSLTLLLVIVDVFPTTVVAGSGIGMGVLSVVYLAAVAVGRAIETTTTTGQNIGAVTPDRAARATQFAGRFVFGVLAIWAWSPGSVSMRYWRVHHHPDVARSGALFLRSVAPTFGSSGSRECSRRLSAARARR